MKKFKSILISKSRRNKKLLYFLCGLALIGVISGSLFLTFINETDRNLVTEYITSFIKSIEANNLNYLEAFKNTYVSSITYILVLFILSLSIIGIPIVIFLYFVKSFMIGFSISSFVFTYGIKGSFFSIIYMIPHFINYIFYTIFLIYAIKISYLLINLLFSKKEVSIKNKMTNYVTYTCILVFITLITAVFESICVPLILKNILFLIK